MRHIVISLIALLLSTTAAMAQNQVVYSQYIEGNPNTIEINKGWQVWFVPRSDDSTIVKLKMTQPITEAELQSICEYNQHSDKLTLKAAAMELRGQVVEVHSNFVGKIIRLGLGASVYANELTLGRDERTVYLNPGSELVVKKLISKSNLSIEINDGDLMADTLAGDTISVRIRGTEGMAYYGNPMMALLDMSLPGGHNKDIRAFPDSSQVVRIKESACYVDADTIRHIYVSNEEKNNRNHKILANVNFIARSKILTNLPLSSPYSTFGNEYGFQYNFFTQFRLAPKLDMSVGLQVDMVASPLFHSVDVDENGFLQMSAPSANPSRCTEINSYLNFPIKLNWNPFRHRGFQKNIKPDIFSFGFDLTPGFNFQHYVFISSYSNPQQLHTFSREENKISYRNPFRLEAGISYHQLLIPLINSIRLYYNLMPEYRKSSGLPKVHSLGLELKF